MATDHARVQICASLDLMPTFCELAGVDPPKDRALDGASITPLFAGKPVEREQPLFWHYFNALGKPKLAMRDGDWMLLATVTSSSDSKAGSGFRSDKMDLIKSSQPNTYELYNLVDDPSQKRDLAETEADRVKMMAARLKEIWHQVQSEGPDWRQEKR